MKHSKSLLCLTSATLVASGSVLVPTAAAPILDLPTEYTEWISDDGGSAGRELPAISADGRYVVFVGRSEAFAGVWVKDRDNGLAKRVAEGFLFNPDISADGAWVTWAQYGSGVGGQSIWVLNWTNPLAEPELVSLGDDGQSAAAVVDFPSLSDDGRYVAFQSMDDTLDEDVLQGEPGGGPNKVYVRDRDTDDTEMVSVTNENVIVNGNAIKPDISPDGNYVAFASDASVLQGVQEGETTTTYQQVYLRDRAEETTLTVSALPGTAEGELVLGDGISSPIYGPSVSADGTLVAFESDATNLVADDTNGDTDAFVKDMTSGAISRVSVMEDGSEADILADGTTEAPAPEPTMIAMARSGPGGGGSENGGDATDDITPNVGIGPVLSNDGDFVAFESKAALTADDDNGGVATCTQTVGGVSTTVEGYVEPADIYRFDLGEGGELVRESVANPVVDAFEASGYRIDGMSGECTAVNNGVDPAISADGSEVVFVSNGNLTGREVAEEDDHTTLAAATAPVENLAVEPAVYLRRPFVTGDEVDTMSQASVDPYSDEVIEIDYTLLAAETVDEVELFVELPGADEFISAGSDLATDPGGLDGAFTYDTEGVEGVYRFYTVATVGGVDEIPPTSKYVSTIYDITAPETAAIAPSSTTTNTWTVTYEATDDVAGMAKVELFAKALDETTYTKVAEDIGAGIDYKFSYMAGGAAYGSYSFYTIGTDKYSTLVNPDGNIEAAPTTADLVTVYSAPPSPPPGGGVVTDTTAPVSSASAPAVSVTPTWTVTYTATDAGGSGVTKVELFVKKPGATAYVSAGSDTATQDGMFTFDSTGAEGSYSFYTVATDVASNVEAIPTTADATTTYDPDADVTAPVSKATSPRYDSGDGFRVRYTAADEASGSGLAKVDLYVKTPGATSYTRVATDSGDGIDGFFRYVPAAGQGAYAFYTVATDTAGNAEAAPSVADTVTTVDSTMPQLRRRMGAGPLVFDRGEQRRLTFRFRVSERVQATFLIRHDGEVVKTIGPRMVGKGLFTQAWFGRDDDKRPVENGRYVLVLRVQDKAGNVNTVRTRFRVTR